MNTTRKLVRLNKVPSIGAPRKEPVQTASFGADYLRKVLRTLALPVQDFANLGNDTILIVKHKRRNGLPTYLTKALMLPRDCSGRDLAELCKCIVADGAFCVWQEEVSDAS